MDPFTVGWLLWGVYFLILEAVAIFRKTTGDTLSEHIWMWFGVRDDKPGLWGWIRRIALTLFMIWLTVHFIFGV